MKKTFLTFLLFINSLLIFAQNLQTPDEFLGYKLGSRFNFHHRIIDYVKYVASQRPNQIKIVEYGSTYEGRPLMIAVVASTENFIRIEEIRTSNLKSIGLMDGKATTKVPAIAWLSYNVHGNEAVSSEAVMQVLYELMNKNNATTQEILKNTVVILDPCINPDGRDRYAQWYNRAVGKTPNPSPFAWEHNEPWPGGRFNHYLFDLNRDWAWQLQKESQERIKLYNSWMPHLHSDFHEMGVNTPYYMPPSSKPYHEDLSKWQRDFQNTLGEFNKKYFDKNYWLYYTKENYDLLYPSYGDTYPSYNGAIGMTFEQGGGGRGGVAIAKEDGDTLTLKQRIDHHFSTSIGTLESISSRANQTVEEFVKYFENARNGNVGVYKSFVLKTKGDEGKIKALTSLLDKLQISYGFAQKESNANGFNYQSLKDENFKVEANDLIISTSQPKGTMAKILFEPKTALEDSITYDITTWAMPYAYNLKAFATKEKISGGQLSANGTQQSVISGKPYAYLASYKSFEDVKFLAKILASGIKVRSNEMPFEIEGKKFDVGSLIITRTNNERMGDKFDKIIQETAKSLNINLVATASGMVTKGSDFGSNYVNVLKNPKVATISGEGVSPTAIGEVWHFFEQQLGYPITVIDGNSFSRVPLDEIDVLVLAEGSYDRIFGNGDALKKWIQGGGKVIAMESATGYFADKDSYALKKKKDATPLTDKPDFKPYNNREREGMNDQIPGAIYKVELDKTHPLAYGYDDNYYALVREPFNFEYLKEGWNVGYLKENNYVTGFAGKKAKEKMKNTMMLGVQDMGRGKIIYMADNPLFRGFWYGGKLLFGNAIFMVN